MFCGGGGGGRAEKEIRKRKKIYIHTIYIYVCIILPPFSPPPPFQNFYPLSSPFFPFSSLKVTRTTQQTLIKGFLQWFGVNGVVVVVHFCENGVQNPCKHKNKEGKKTPNKTPEWINNSLFFFFLSFFLSF